ncbi:hypothetical protein [Saccharothrix sp. HUAS TT1]|uniref:hypothetical protein n=1 Tax=unclassified Saccharothrix TaxID=2593673 RepID=UPI00345BCC97
MTSADTLPDTVEDKLLWPLLRVLRTCAATQLGLVRRSVCAFPIVVGATAPPADRCDCTCRPPGSTAQGQGQAWIRFVTGRTVPRTAANGRQLPADVCGGLSWALTVELGVYRCWPTLDQHRNPPSDAAYDKASHGMTRDQAALRRAVACCAPLARKSVPWNIDQAGPMSPSGGCVGVYQTATFTRDDCTCPQGGEQR